MQYIWIVMLIIFEIIWCIYSVKDIIYCCKHFTHPIQCFEDYTNLFIVIHIMVIFGISFGLWLERIIR